MNAVLHQAVDRAALEQIVVPSVGAGVVIGRDQAQVPIAIRLFRPQPTIVTLVGGWWGARLVAFRALATGALLAVHAAAAHHWQGFGEAATNRPDRMGFVDPSQPVALPSSRRRPVLYVHDLVAAQGGPPPPLSPWQCALVVVPQLVPGAARAVSEADLCVVQRLGESEAVLAGSVLRLPADSVGHLQLMPDDLVGLLSAGTARYAWTAQTNVEKRLLGPPSRG
jgi:hypothetical protein